MICEPIPCSCMNAKTCVEGCTRPAQCGVAETCSDGHRCVPAPCNITADCPAYFACANGGCTRATCATDADCALGYCVTGACYDTLGQCMLPVP